MLHHELSEALLRIESFEAVGKPEERRVSVLTAVNIATHMGYETGIRHADDPTEESDTVAYIVLPSLGEVSYFLPKAQRKYDGYTREEKLSRVRMYVDGLYDEEDEDEGDDL